MGGEQGEPKKKKLKEKSIGRCRTCKGLNHGARME